MKTYEMIYVLDASLADEAKEALAKKFEDIVTSKGGKVLTVDKWGVKKLAYPINYKTDGDYTVMTFEADGAVVKEIERVSDLTAEVLRRMITVKA
ncbi:MAG: 30S ribosomal protein S6 [Clostridia bacterium]|nr:30S ribosomal protein S6 [Clostridia bacterium]